MFTSCSFTQNLSELRDSNLSTRKLHDHTDASRGLHAFVVERSNQRLHYHLTFYTTQNNARKFKQNAFHYKS